MGKMQSLSYTIFNDEDIQECEQDIERLKHYRAKIEEIIIKHELSANVSFNPDSINSVLQSLAVDRDNHILNKVDSFKQKIITSSAKKT